MSVSPVPPGFRTITPHLSIKGCSDAIAFYKKAYGAEERMRMPGPGGAIMHAELQIGDSILMCADEWPGGPTRSPATAGGATCTIALYVADCDQWFHRAVAAGATAVMPPNDAFWGDRYAMVKDPFGHTWSFATHVEDVSPEEIGKRMEAMMKNGGPCG